MKTLALLGNPNVGKTTLFNLLTGDNQHVGNWAGVTVDKKEGYLNNFKIVDLPGIYAMDTFSHEEKISKNFLETENVDAIINIVDASNLDRNLYLTMQLKEYKKPIILVLNMIDLATYKGIEIDYEKLSKELNVKVIPIVAAKDNGIDDIISYLNSTDFSMNSYDNDYHFNSAEETYAYIESITKKCIIKKEVTKETISNKIDKTVLNPFLSYPIFIGIMMLVFEITFTWVGQPLSDMLDTFLNEILMPFIGYLLSNSSPWFSSLIVDGIVGGVGGIVVLLPVILALFICISVLEDSGYMARIAFIMDSLMRKMGLSGKAFIPMMVGFGCSVPAIMSARTLESEKDRKLAALLVPFMSCNAKLPVYAIFAATFFPGKESLVIASLYFLGIIIAFILGIIFKNTLFKKDEEPFLIELPEYKVPEIKSVCKQTWDKGKNFLKKAGTIIFSMSVIIWFLSNFNFNGMVQNINDSILATIGTFIAPIFSPLGFGNWEASVSLLTGLLAKETVISSMEIIYAGDLSLTLTNHFTMISAYAFLVFVLLYTPCISAIGAFKKEYGNKMASFMVLYQFTVAWFISFLVFNIGNLIF